MSGYHLARTRLYQPSAEVRDTASALGEWVTSPARLVIEAWGCLTAVVSEPSASYLGQAPRALYRWRGRLPAGVEPTAGWELEAAGRRFQVLQATSASRRLWRLELEDTAQVAEGGGRDE